MRDSVTITLNATTMEGLGAVDPQVVMDVLETHPTAHTVHSVTLSFSSTATVQFPMPDHFPVWQVNFTFSRFDVESGFSFQPRGIHSPVFNVKVARNPMKWSIEFVPRSTLNPAQFGLLGAVLGRSNAVDLKHGLAVGDLNRTYDTLADPAQVLAKAALLNLYSVLTEEIDPTAGHKPWFGYVHAIVLIDRERFVATIDPALFESVSRMVNERDTTYAGRRYATEADGGRTLHQVNIPVRYDAAANLQQMATVKIPYRQGNVQLTISFLRVDGEAVHLLDCDMDENLNLGKHFFDLIKHLFNGGTHPLAMHEYIVADSASNAPNGIATIDLGYRLV